MLHPSPFASVDDIQLVQPFVQRVAEWAIKIAVEKKQPLRRIHREMGGLPIVLIQLWWLLSIPCGYCQPASATLNVAADSYWRCIMISAIHTALSGLSAFGKQLDVSAHNVANVNTDGFKSSRTEFVEAQSGGVLPVVQKDNSAGPSVLKDTAEGPRQVELSNVDLGQEVASQIIAQRGFEANLRTLKTADTMLGSILDTKK
jgi:flagellar basal body rod protein FlgC